MLLKKYESLELNEWCSGDLINRVVKITVELSDVSRMLSILGTKSKILHREITFHYLI